MHFILSFILFLFLSVQNSFASYQFFKLVQQWPSSTCNVARCTFVPPVSNFTLHGLWGTNKTTPYPARCTTTPYDSNSINALKPRMKTSWPSLTTPHEDFWNHEWEVHGTCSEYNFKQFDYSKLALDSKDRVDLLKILSNGGFIPSQSAKLSPSNIKNLIMNRLQADPELRCNIDKTQVIQLHEIVLCMDDQGKNFISCPYSADTKVKLCNTAAGGVTFPP